MLAKVSLVGRLRRELALCGVSAIIVGCVYDALPQQLQRVTAPPTADQNVSIATVENYIARSPLTGCDLARNAEQHLFDLTAKVRRTNGVLCHRLQNV